MASSLEAPRGARTGTGLSSQGLWRQQAGAGTLALALVDPNGLLMMRYDAGYDAARLRQDIVKVVH